MDSVRAVGPRCGSTERGVRVARDKQRWRGLAAVLVLGLMPAVSLAQTGTEKKDAQAPAKESAAPDAHAKKFEDIGKRLAEAQKKFEERLKAATSDEEREKIQGEGGPEKAFLGEYQALAVDAKGTEVAAKALCQVMLLGVPAGDLDATKAAAKTLMAEHVESPEMALLVFAAPQLLGKAEGKQALELLKAKNKTKPVAAAFLFMEVQSVSDQKGEDSPELEALYRRLSKEFGDLKFPFGEETYGGVAEAWIFVKENLVVGKVAPGFEAVDENGAKWKLEEYRGKVVVIDFWGDW